MLAPPVFLPAPKPVILRDEAYLDWLRWQRCVICTLLGEKQETSSDPAHTPRTRIHGDVACSLCRKHHLEEERLQPAAFGAKYGKSMAELAALSRALYLVDAARYAW